MKKMNIQLAVFALFAVSLLFSTKAFSNPTGPAIPESAYDLMAAEDDSTITFDSVKNQLSTDGEWIKVNPNEIDSESVTDGSQDVDEDINTEYVWRPYGCRRKLESLHKRALGIYKLRLDVGFVLQLGLETLPLRKMVVVTCLGLGMVTRLHLGAIMGCLDGLR